MPASDSLFRAGDVVCEDSFCSACCSPLAAGQRVDHRWHPGPPLKFLDAQGVPHGLDVDVVSTIFGKLRIPIRIELTDSGARLTRNAETGVYDLVMTLLQAGRERYLLYPSRPPAPQLALFSCARPTC